jgi:hypothetical protein
MVPAMAIRGSVLSATAMATIRLTLRVFAARLRNARLLAYTSNSRAPAALGASPAYAIEIRMTVLFIRAGLVVLAYNPASLLVAFWLAIAFGFDYNETQRDWVKSNKLLLRFLSLLLAIVFAYSIPLHV